MQTENKNLFNETSGLLDEIIPILNKYIQMLKDDVNPQGGAVQYLLKQEIESLNSLLQRTKEVNENVKRHLKSEPPIRQPRPTREYAGDITVIMAGGQKICHSRVSMTFAEVIEKIGIDRVKSLDMVSRGIPIIATVKHPVYNQITSGNYYIMTNTNTDQKIAQLKEIKRRLNINIEVIDNRK